MDEDSVASTCGLFRTGRGPDNRTLLATTGNDRTVRIWDLGAATTSVIPVNFVALDLARVNSDLAIAGPEEVLVIRLHSGIA
ncbi:hypothetical protein ACWD6R_15995 [Streptomyces sp. NPDC005151]